MNYFYKTFLVCLSALCCSCVLNCTPYRDDLAEQFNSGYNKKQLPYGKYIEQLKVAIKDEYIQRSNGINKDAEFNLGGWAKVAERGSLKDLPCYKQPSNSNKDQYHQAVKDDTANLRNNIDFYYETVKHNTPNLNNNTNYFTYKGRVFITDKNGRINREVSYQEPPVEDVN